MEQCLRFLQVGDVESLGEPTADGSEEVAGLGSPAVALPEAGERRGLDPVPRIRAGTVRATSERMMMASAGMTDE